MNNEILHIPITPTSPPWLMSKIVDALIKSGFLRHKEVDLGNGRRMLETAVRMPDKKLYKRINFSPMGYPQLINACIDIGLPVIMKDNLGYYVISSADAVLECLKKN